MAIYNLMEKNKNGKQCTIFGTWYKDLFNYYYYFGSNLNMQDRSCSQMLLIMVKSYKCNKIQIYNSDSNLGSSNCMSTYSVISGFETNER